MNWDVVAAVAELVAAIGVIASLIYVARQLRRVVGNGFVEVWGPIDLLPEAKEKAKALVTSFEQFLEENKAEIDALPSRTVLAEYAGEATIEGYTVMYGGEAPVIAHCGCQTPAGERVWVNSEDKDLMNAMTQEEFCGRTVRISAAGELSVI